MKKKQTILAAAAVILVLAFAFWYGGDAPGLRGWSPAGSSSQSSTSTSVPSGSDTSVSLPEADSASSQEESRGETPAVTEGDSSAPQEPVNDAQEQDAPDQSVPAESTPQKPEPTTPSNPVQSEPEPEEQATTCSISIVCSTVLDHLDWLAEGKADIVPAGGVMLSATELEPQEGETAFSLLQRAARAAGIPMEASFTPGTGSAYVEGIGNLYEFDCGQRSGWLYFVNGISPGYSASEYTLKPGDRVEWVYTCDMGQDVGATVAGG